MANHLHLLTQKVDFYPIILPYDGFIKCALKGIIDMQLFIALQILGELVG